MTTLSAGRLKVITLNGQAGVFTAISDSSIPVYSGEHHVIPKTEGQELPTKNTRLTRNITVAAVPYYETGNDCRGKIHRAEGLPRRQRKCRY